MLPVPATVRRKFEFATLLLTVSKLAELLVQVLLASRMTPVPLVELTVNAPAPEFSVMPP